MKKNDKIVFIGDSITEWGRGGDPEDIGTGYVRLIHDYLVTAYPDKKTVVLNKGVGGHRIPDLASRWGVDVINENPAYVSISIGINDVWRQLDHPEKEQVYPEKFEEIYLDLLTQVKEKTNAKMILMEPTIIKEEEFSEGNQKLARYAKIVERLAEKFDAIYVPTHKAFIEYLQADNHYLLTLDGVHTNSAGNMLMAQTWIKAFENHVRH
ncbi:SGNH/GDSL hydrolase family protein [Robertmurraya sp. GLU-23]